MINKHFNVDGRASFFYKPVEPNRTPGMTSRLALDRLKTLLKSKNHAFIYHCYNHYCCPIGYEAEPRGQTEVYEESKVENNENNNDDNNPTVWVLVAETSRKYPAFHCIKWSDIERDLTTRSPDFVNIRKLDKGVQTRRHVASNENNTNADEERPQLRVKKDGRNLHCLIMLQSFSSGGSEATSTPQVVDDEASPSPLGERKNSDNVIEYLDDNENSDSE